MDDRNVNQSECEEQPCRTCMARAAVGEHVPDGLRAVTASAAGAAVTPVAHLVDFLAVAERLTGQDFSDARACLGCAGEWLDVILRVFERADEEE